MRYDVHRKMATFGLVPFGMRVEYYCPKKDRSTKLKTDYADVCPLCGEPQGWGEVRA